MEEDKVFRPNDHQAMPVSFLKALEWAKEGPDHMSKVIHPLGAEAGQELRLSESLNSLAIEILAHRSGLLEAANREERLQVLGPASALYLEGVRQRAAELERYAVAVQSLALQVDPTRWNPKSFAGLLELARQNGVTLPEWMTGPE